MHSSPHRASGSGASLALAGAALVLAGYLVWDRFDRTPLHDDAESRPVAARGELAPFEQNLVEIYERNSPSVVHVTTHADFLTRTGMVTVPEGSGSGFIWDARGYVVTNYHVIQSRQPDRQVVVHFDDQRGYAAEVVGESRFDDIAVLKLVNPPRDLRPLPIGDSSELRVGQVVVAIGSPFGLSGSMTFGVVSALDRTMQSVVNTEIDGVIQTDAPINPGNSGGPLLDSAGRLIGMNTAIKSTTRSSAGIGFAVPVNTINRVVPQLIRGSDQADRPILGIRPSPVQLAGRGRIMAQSITPGSGAEAAGMLGNRVVDGRRAHGDVLLRVGNREIYSTDDIAAELSRHQPGDVVEVVIWRADANPQEVSLQVKLTREGDYN